MDTTNLGVHGAVFSDCGTWRYRLWNRWDTTGPIVGYVGVNPSTAGRPGAPAKWWDLTARKFEGFARRNGFGGWYAGNLFGLVSTNPQGLRFISDPIGPDNDEHLRFIAGACERVVVCWGATGAALGNRARHVEGILEGADLWCLGRTRDGHPRHPSRLAYTTPLVPYVPNPTTL